MIKKTKKPKVGSLVFDRDQNDWGIILKIRNQKGVLFYTIQFIDDPSPIVMTDIHDSAYQECYN